MAIIKGVLFDLDGTLTLPGALDFPGIRRRMGCPENRPILEFLETVDPAERPGMEAVLEAAELEAAEVAAPNEGAEACIRSLCGFSVPLGIITRNCRSSVEVTLQRLGSISREDFSVIVCREDAVPKPDPAGVVLAAREMGVNVDELLVVGDFRFDIEAGGAAGALTAVVTNGRPCPWLKDCSPDWVVSGLAEIARLVENNLRALQEGVARRRM